MRQMFDRVAPRYDLTNTVLSLGQDRHWRRVAVHAADLRPGDLVADVASGSGALAEQLRRAGARVVALDLSLEMLRTGARRESAHPSIGLGLLWANADANRLPLPDAGVDALTIAFGLRNLPEPAAALREFARVVRPGGRLVVLEFATPGWAPFRLLYERYLTRALPLAAHLVASDPAAYRYLADSIRAWPDQAGLARMIADAGWVQVQWKSLSGGIVAAHRARRPGP